MIEVTREEWKRISKDYKGKNRGGQRQCFGGCIAKDGGTRLFTEGINFIIVKEKTNEGESKTG